MGSTASSGLATVLGMLFACLHYICFLPRYCADRNIITELVRKWCGEDTERKKAFTRAWISITGLIGYDYLTASARDMSIALVMAVKGGSK